MPKTKTLVEVVVPTPEGKLPLGIMNVEQALSLPDDIEAEVLNPGSKPGEKDAYMPVENLEKHPEAPK